MLREGILGFKDRFTFKDRFLLLRPQSYFLICSISCKYLSIKVVSSGWRWKVKLVSGKIEQINEVFWKNNNVSNETCPSPRMMYIWWCNLFFLISCIFVHFLCSMYKLKEVIVNIFQFFLLFSSWIQLPR